MSQPPLTIATSTFADGNMSFSVGETTDALANRQQFLRTRGLSYETCVTMMCDHGETILAVDETSAAQGASAPQAMPVAEVLHTNSTRVSLLLLTADCVPAIFYDPAHHTLALAHLNRKTIAHRLAMKTITTMQNAYGTDPTELLVWFEPHIHAANYHFPLPLEHEPPAALQPHCFEEANLLYIDFARAHFDEICTQGVPAQNITISPTDVFTENNYFSHTKAKQNLRPAGRHATVVALH